MATIDKTGGAPTAGAIPYAGLNKFFTVSNTVDLTGGAITQGDVYQCLAIPAGTLVESVHIMNITPAVGTTLTVNIGDGGSTAGWIGSFDGKSAADTWDHSTVGTDARSVAANNGYFYAAADSIDMVMTTATAITAGPKFKITAVCVAL